VADDITNPLTPTGETPAAAQPAAGGTFVRRPADVGRRRPWRRTAAVVSALALLCGVGAVAALTGSGSSGADTPPYGAVRAAVAPPELGFTTASDGYAFYADCKRSAATDGCVPRLFHTTDAGAHWVPQTLPVGTPSTPSLWGQMQVTAQGVVLPWANGALLSHDGGPWTAPPVLGLSAVVAPGDVVVDESDQSVLVDLVHGGAAVLGPAIPVTTPWATGTLTGNRLWIRDFHQFAVSADSGRSWKTTRLANADLDVVRAAPTGKLLARLQVPLAGTTLGVAGDGGEYPVASVLLSRDNGVSWQRTPVSGPAVNGACTVLLANGDLLGVAVDGSGLLRLPAGQRVFAPVSTGPTPVPSCLTNNGAGVYGPTFSARYVTSVDGSRWRTVALPVT
jgi:hypothetical protein